MGKVVEKTLAWTTYDDIVNTAGPLEASGGLTEGAETAIHAIKEIYQQDSIEGVILVDASNAFNPMNQQTALRNIQYICPHQYIGNSAHNKYILESFTTIYHTRG